MPHFFFLWNEEIEAHLAEHGVLPEEFEEVVCDASLADIQKSKSSGRPIIFGETWSGKYLACVFEYLDNETVIPVSAYEID